MKRIIYTLLTMLCFVVMMTSANFNTVSSEIAAAQIKKQHCFGYTVIEAGKGIDCYGDTVALVKTHGFYEIASRNNPAKNHELVLN